MNYTDSIRNFLIAITIMLIGTIMLFRIGTIDFHSILATGKVMLPAIIILGFLGQKMGEIVDNPKNKTDADYKNAVLNALKKMDKKITLDELNDKLSATIAEPDLPDNNSDEDLDI